MLNYFAHEMKNKAMNILVYSESFLDHGSSTGGLKESARLINTEATRMASQARNLLSLSGSDYWESVPISSRQYIKMHELIAEWAECYQWRRKDIMWDIRVEPATIYGSREHWVILLENLLDNQTRYAKSRIEITLKKEEGRLVLRIWNDGPAIEKKTMDSLFQQFCKGASGEHGLGLAIVKKIVEIHSGNIRAVNENGGVAFCIELPVPAQFDNSR